MNIGRHIKVIAFDADDTLWSNEPLFREAEGRVWDLLADCGDPDFLSAELYRTEIANMPDYGYGALAFLLSLIETAARTGGKRLDGRRILDILAAGRQLLHNPAKPLEGVAETLARLREDGRHTLVLFTKGELLTQENKIRRSGLAGYFDRIDIVSDKRQAEYLRLCAACGIGPEQFLMVGNSFKSDIAPVLEIGGYGAYLPAEMVWQLERTEEYAHPRLFRLHAFREIMNLIH